MRSLAVFSISLILLVLAARERLVAQHELAGSARIRQSLDRLNVVASVLMIAAHPDDENTALLAYFARGRHLRTGYLSLTRGEGGQNFIGPEQGAALGVIRTQELLAARRIDGAEQFFSRAIDFGFSKSADETMTKWGREDILGDIVWTIRRFRPDVIVLRFSGTPRDGHGQHQASAILGKEAFFAAADPLRFPEQLKWVQPWQAKRIMWNAFAFTREQQKANESLTDKVTIDSGEYNTVLGYSYEEIAGMSRSEHRSQAMGVPERKGAWKNQLVPVAGDAAKQDAFDGVDLTWKRVPGGERVGELIAEATRRFDPEHPGLIVPTLLQARRLAASLKDKWAEQKLPDLNETIALCAGLWVDTSAQTASVVPGSELKINAEAISRSTLNLTMERIEVAGAGSATDTAATALPANQLVTRTLTVRIPASEPFTQPYWLREPRQSDRYTVADQQILGLPQSPAPLQAKFVVKLEGEELEFVRPVAHRYVDTARGERMRPLEIVPAVALKLPETAIVFPRVEAKTVEIAVKSTTGPASGEVRLNAPDGWTIAPSSRPYQLAAGGQQAIVAFRLTPPSGASRAVLTASEGSSASGLQVIDYPHIPPQTLFPKAEATMVRADIRNLAHHIGYIMGPGDDMPEALRQLGCDVTLLDAETLATGDLGRFDAIITGVRAHSSRPDMLANRARLLDYVSRGGTLVVQYNRPEGDFHVADTIGPYPLKISNLRVSVEEAPVEFTNAASPLLEAPNRITKTDFDGWVQERGLYFANEWDAQYQTVFVCNDPGEKPLPGGTLYTKYGKGVYVFTAYSWFRQLPAGVPGAYRIFANLISAGKVMQHAASAASH